VPTEIHHGDTENTEKLTESSHNTEESALTERVIGMAIEVHRYLSQDCLSRHMRNVSVFEFRTAGVAYECQVALTCSL